MFWLSKQISLCTWMPFAQQHKYHNINNIVL